jgi:predicted HTH domain antitoxin
VELKLPAAIANRITPTEAALHLAVGLFMSETATLGQAAEVAGLTQPEFLAELANRRIPIHYGTKELAEDLVAVDQMSGK